MYYIQYRLHAQRVLQFSASYTFVHDSIEATYYYNIVCRLNPSRARRKSGTTMTIVPTLLGEMLLHSNQVKV